VQGQPLEVAANAFQCGDPPGELGRVAVDERSHVGAGSSPRLRTARISRISPSDSVIDCAARMKPSLVAASGWWSR